MKRTMSRLVSDILKGRRRMRIVVLGSANCGKTVFLTSLASHLRHHDPEEFSLNGWEVSWEKELLSNKESELAQFPYAEYRKGFEKAIPEFPEKTTAEMSVLRLPLVLKKGVEDRAILLELMDLPGERVADLVMARKSYREWCEWMQDAFVKDRASESYRDYLEMIKIASAPEDLFKAYKGHLLSEYEKYSPWLTPSTVKLSNGTAKGLREDIDTRLLGVDVESQFVPLPIEAFKSGHPLNGYVKKFESGYNKYRKEIVRPIADWLSEADHLIYLVDVLGILKKGVSAYNAEAAFGADVIGMFKRHKTRAFLGSIVDRLVGLFKTELKGACLVATKADIACGEAGRENMCNLASQILGKPMRELGLSLQSDYARACASVKTVTNEATARQCITSNEETDYSQLVVPERWPDSRNWDAGKFWFEDTFPRFDERRNAAPPQLGLDKLVFAILKNFVI